MAKSEFSKAQLQEAAEEAVGVMDARLAYMQSQKPLKGKSLSARNHKAKGARGFIRSLFNDHFPVNGAFPIEEYISMSYDIGEHPIIQIVLCEGIRAGFFKLGVTPPEPD